MDVLSDKIVIARKNYLCNACEAWNRDPPDELTEDEKRIVAEAEADGWRIKMGQKYRRQEQVDGGEFFTYRARPDMDRLCWKYCMFFE